MSPEDFIAESLILKEPFIILNIADKWEDAFEVADSLLFFFEVIAYLFFLVIVPVIGLVFLLHANHIRLVQTHQPLFKLHFGFFFK